MTDATRHSCGGHPKALADRGLEHVVRSTDVEILFALFKGELDIARCDVCQRAVLGVLPTVAVIFTAPSKVYVVVGSLAQQHRQQLLDDLRRHHIGTEPTVEEHSSLDDLRLAVAAQLSRVLTPLNSFAAAKARGDAPSYILNEWGAWTPQVLSAGLLAPILPGIQIIGLTTSEDDPSQSDYFQEFVRLQSKVWLGLVAARFGDQAYGEPLEEDLQRYIHRDIILNGAPEALFADLDTLQAHPGTRPHEHYCIEALRASICITRGWDNPHADQWAEYFFQYELWCRRRGDAVPPLIKAMTISDARAQATLSFRPVYGAVMRRIQEAIDAGLMGMAAGKAQEAKQEREQLIEMLNDVTTKAGYAHLVAEVVNDYIASNTSEDARVEELIDFMRRAAAETGQTEATIDYMQIQAHLLIRPDRVDDLERLADAMLDLVGAADDARAGIEAWLGACLKTLHEPQRFLNRVGDTARPQELYLAPRTRARLWMERSNALRLAGRLDEAHKLSLQIVELFSAINDPEACRIAERNRAILDRETGSPDVAPATLKTLLTDKTMKLSERIDVLDSLAMSYLEVMRPSDALHWLDEAIHIAISLQMGVVSRLKAKRALALTTVGRLDEAVQELLVLPIDASQEPDAVLSEVAAWTNILANDVKVPRAVVDRLQRLRDAVSKISDEAATRGDAHAHVGAFIVWAALCEILKHDDAEQLWEQAVITAVEQYRQPPDPQALISVARYAYERGEDDRGHGYLTMVPEALTARLGGITDIAGAVQGPGILRHALNALTSTLLGEGRRTRPCDARLVAELRRDVIGRAQTSRRAVVEMADAAALADGLTDEVLARLAPPTGRLAVLEWVDNGEWIVTLLTTITADGTVSLYYLTAPEVDPLAVAPRLYNRLQTWSCSRPFDMAEWRSLEGWLVEQLSPHLEEDDHVVVIEHERYAGMPWHVALASRWTASYAAGWASLLVLASLPVRRLPTNLGIVLVPGATDKDKIINDLRESARRAQIFAADRGLELVTVPEQECNHGAFREIVGRVDVAKFLCHGFVALEDDDVGLMLAHDGNLPLTELDTAKSETARRHRLSWQQCQQLPTTPPVIFSAACSSNYNHIAGLGERLGLFSALRHGGTRALIAPRWDFDVSGTPILDAVLERYMGGVSLASALRSACREAATDLPRQVAWALALEGDWR